MFCNNNVAPISLNDFSAYLMDEHSIEISKQSINERFNEEAVVFLQKVLTTQLNNALDSHQYRAGLKESFSRVLIKDSTRFNLPEAYSEKYKGHGGCTANSASMVSIQFEYECLTGKVCDLRLTSGRRNDQQDARESMDHIQENDLRISDLGYSTMAYMKALSEKKAFFLNRFHPQCSAYDLESGDLIDFQKLQEKMRKKGILYLEKQVLIGSKYKLPYRIVIALVDNEVYNQRIRKANRIAKSNGYQLSEDYKTRAGLSIFVTNAPSAKITSKQVIDVYRLRWQIELIFKVWKSLGKIDQVQKVKLQRFECQLIARLIWLMTNWSIFLVINQWMINRQGQEKACSIWKYFKQATINSEKLKIALFQKQSMHEWLQTLFKKAERNLFREKRTGKLPSLEIINILLT